MRYSMPKEVKEQLAEVTLFLHCVGPRDHTQVVRFGRSHPYTLSHLTGPGLLILTYPFKSESS